MPPLDEDDGRRAEARVVHHPAPRTPLRKLPRRRLSLTPAPPAEPVRRVPTHDLPGPPGHPEKVFVNPEEEVPHVSEDHALGRFGVRLDGPAGTPVEVPDLPPKRNVEVELFGPSGERHPDGPISEHDQPLVPEGEPQRLFRVSQLPAGRPGVGQGTRPDAGPRVLCRPGSAPGSSFLARQRPAPLPPAPRGRASARPSASRARSDPSRTRRARPSRSGMSASSSSNASSKRRVASASFSTRPSLGSSFP